MHIPLHMFKRAFESVDVQLPAFFLCVCARVPPCIHQPATLLSSDALLSLRSRKIALAVSLADVAGRSPGGRRRETIPTKWHELM